MIEVDAISKWYGDHRALNNVRFSVSSGGITGLLGPNGAGKSTLLRLIVGILHPDRGDVRINGVSVVEDSLGARRSIGYLPESAPLYPDLTPEEHLKFSAQARGLSGRGLDRAVEEASTRCNIRSEMTTTCRSLSKGFRQRVALAQALVGDPPVLLLDEPTTGLDPNQIMETRAMIHSLCESHTVLFSTHILPEAEAVCDRVVILGGGEVVADSGVRELHSARKYVDLRLASRPDDSDLSVLESIARIESKSRDGRDLAIVLSAGRETADLFDWAVKRSLRVESLTPRVETLESLFAGLVGTADET